MLQDDFENLLSSPVFSDSAEDDLLFDRAMRNAIERHYKENQYYRNFLNAHGWDGQYEIGELPPLPVGAFKHAAELTKLGDSEGLTLKSSGTSGALSQIFIDRITSTRQKKSLSLVMENFLGQDRLATAVFDIDPRKSSDLGARQAAILGFTRHSSSTLYLMEPSETGPRMKPDWKELLDSFDEKPLLLIGFTYILFEHLSSVPQNSTLKLPVGSRLIHIGGWKKLQERAVSPKDFKVVISNTLGIFPENIHDIYGFTELMGVSFVECEFEWKHVPKWVRARVIEPTSLGAISGIEEGLLTFESPLANSYLGLSIVTDDVGLVDSGQKPCGCGREGQRLKVTGRRTKAEIRGCGDILASNFAEAALVTPVAEHVTVLFPKSLTGGVNEFQEAIDTLRNRENDLGNLNHSDILRIIDILRTHWKKIEEADASGTLRANGLGFLIDWAKPDKLRNLLDFSIAEGRESLDRWVPRSFGSQDKVRNLPLGLVSQWVSGNVPVLGIFPILYCWLTGNTSISRISSSGSDLTVELLKPLMDLAAEDPTAKTLAEATMLCTFQRNNHEAHVRMSSAANAVIAWGGSEAIAAISALPTSPETRRYFFGPRTSYAVVFESMLDSERKTSGVARRLVADVAVFDQAACASPHSVFVVARDPGASERLAKAVYEEFLTKSQTQPLGALDSSLVSEIALYRSRKSLDSQVYSVQKDATVILSASSKSLPEPVFGRTLHIQPLEKIESLERFVTPFVQSVGLLGTESELIQTANLLAPLGVKRFPTIGRMTNFENPWDGVNLVSGLLRTSTLSGPR